MESGQSRSQDLPVARIPFTPAQRQKLDQAIGNTLSSTFVQMIQDSDENSSLVVQDYAAVICCALVVTNHALRCNHMENVLDNDNSPVETVRQHPELCKIVRTACQTGCFSTICDTEILQIPNTGSPVLADSGFTRE